MMRRQVLGHDGGAALQVDVDAAGVVFGRVLEAELLADLFDFGFDLLDVAGRVVAFAYDAAFERKKGKVVSDGCVYFQLDGGMIVRCM